MSSSPAEILLPHRPADAPAAVAECEHPSLLVALAAVPDPRDPRGRRYPLVSMLAVAVCAVLAGACTFAAIADWARDLDRSAWARLGFTDQVPAATTVWRLLIRVDAEVLSNEIPAFAPLVDKVAAQLGSLDGVLVVADALHAQTGHAERVAAAGGHLMVSVKGNQCATRRSDTSPPQAGQTRREVCWV